MTMIDEEMRARVDWRDLLDLTAADMRDDVGSHDAVRLMLLCAGRLAAKSAIPPAELAREFMMVHRVLKRVAGQPTASETAQNAMSGSEA